MANTFAASSRHPVHTSDRAAADGAAAVDQKLWYGCIPVVFSLHASEVTTLHAPRPFYAMIPRMSYLMAQTRDVVEYFRDAAPPFGGLQGASIWFEANGVPLKWHLPFGVLWDILSGGGSDSERAPVLPWQVTVHFQGFPHDEVRALVAYTGERRAHFLTLRVIITDVLAVMACGGGEQATFLRSGSTKVIMGMPEAQQSQIWTSVIKNDFQSYREATKDLQLDHEDVRSSSNMRLIPVRVHLDRAPAIQMPITPLTNDQEERTVYDVLSYLLPDVFPSQDCAVIVHGIPVPSEISVLSLYRSFAYADGFLYVSVIPRQS